MPVQQIDLNDKRAVQSFIQLPFDIYRGNPYWVPPMRSDLQAALDPQRHPFYQHSQAAFFLARAHGQVQGRLAILDNERYKAHTGQQTGFFYFFECVDDLEVSQALFQAGFEWARQRGLKSLIGPKGLAQGDGLGLLVEGFADLPAMGIPYNPPYYARLIETAGFTKETDYLSGYLSSDYQLPERVFELAERVKARRGLWVRRFESKAEMRAVIPEIHKVYNSAFKVVPNFVPITQDEIELVANRILSVADPRLIKLIYKRDELIGFLFAYKNIGAGLRKADGRMWPFGWWHILRAFRTTRVADFNGIGLLPEHQGVGATAILYTELEKTAREFDFEHANIVQIAETNMKSFGEADHLGVTWDKRHRSYQVKL
ncbi:MAG: hypothetical protein JW862_08915 [Anaerolineales bacterium]|nr:hypothetical protein [Anaerolineales bacterium]